MQQRRHGRAEEAAHPARTVQCIDLKLSLAGFSLCLNFKVLTNTLAIKLSSLHAPDMLAAGIRKKL